MLRRIWRSPVTTVVLGILFLISFSSSVYYHVNVYSVRKMVERMYRDQPDVQTETETDPELSEQTVQMEEMPVEAAIMSDSIWIGQASGLLADNAGREAAVIRQIHTTKPATAVIFDGIGTQEEVRHVLGVLNANLAVGTFFVSRTQMETDWQTITEIVRSGQQMGILVDTYESSTTGLMCQLLETWNVMQTMYGYAGTLVLRPADGVAGSALCECASALNCPVITETFNATPASLWQMGDPEAMADQVLDEGMPSLQRGGIAHFNLGVFVRESTLGEYLRTIIETRNPYAVIPVTEILRDTASQYVYPLPYTLVSEDVREAIYPGHTTYMNVVQKITNGYIGVEGKNKETLLPGFTYLERDALNRTGMVRNEDDQVFLTFEGWGSDVAVQAILEVLEKHQVHATFFLRTEYAASNPNLVRAIAAGGHDIGTNTHTGVPLAIGLDSNTHFVEINEGEADALAEDLILSYETLAAICGDMTSDSGKASLTTYLRPPDLAVSRRGLEVVFDLGFTYSISGSYDCQDDLARDAIDLANDMRKNTRSGAILILRLSDECLYTAEAVDAYLNRLELSDKHYRFVGLSRALR